MYNVKIIDKKSLQHNTNKNMIVIEAIWTTRSLNFRISCVITTTMTKNNDVNDGDYYKQTDVINKIN